MLMPTSGIAHHILDPVIFFISENQLIPDSINARARLLLLS
jgi:hypothetical protein